MCPTENTASDRFRRSALVSLDAMQIGRSRPTAIVTRSARGVLSATAPSNDNGAFKETTPGFGPLCQNPSIDNTRPIDKGTEDVGRNLRRRCRLLVSHHARSSHIERDQGVSDELGVGA